ncbi:MAG TPA: BolA family protein [Coxiellaceae bacterium]|nr:BolA family protein [Coxiellaceae bacterium]
MHTTELIKQTLVNAFHPKQLHVQDDKAEHVGHAHADSGHFTVTIQADAFQGKSAVEQHRMIYAALGDLMKTHIHALRIRVS